MRETLSDQNVFSEIKSVPESRLSLFSQKNFLIDV